MGANQSAELSAESILRERAETSLKDAEEELAMKASQLEVLRRGAAVAEEAMAKLQVCLYHPTALGRWRDLPGPCVSEIFTGGGRNEEKPDGSAKDEVCCRLVRAHEKLQVLLFCLVAIARVYCQKSTVEESLLQQGYCSGARNKEQTLEDVAELRASFCRSSSPGLWSVHSP